MATRFVCRECGQVVEERTRMDYYQRYEVVAIDGKPCRGGRGMEGNGFAEGFVEGESHDAYYCGCDVFDADRLQEAVRDGHIVLVEEGAAGEG